MERQPLPAAIRGHARSNRPPLSPSATSPPRGGRSPSTDLHTCRPQSPLEAVCATRYAVADFDKERPVTAANT
ncbi:hypothetical protein EOC99_18680, partial [Mesorhizobium sp. M7A.T.Ca.TU.009.01.1.1]